MSSKKYFLRKRTKIIKYVIKKLGLEYDFRLIFELGRFLIPWSLLPRRWHSRLFNYKPGVRTKESCSFLLAEAFQSINFPILPILKTEENSTKLYKSNPRLYSPRDFDYSPYFLYAFNYTAVNQKLDKKLDKE